MPCPWLILSVRLFVCSVNFLYTRTITTDGDPVPTLNCVGNISTAKSLQKSRKQFITDKKGPYHLGQVVFWLYANKYTFINCYLKLSFLTNKHPIFNLFSVCSFVALNIPKKIYIIIITFLIINVINLV